MRVDDILVGGRDDKKLSKNLRHVFIVLKWNGLRLKKEKCMFLKDQIYYLGYKIDKIGLSSIPEKIDALSNAPTPKNVNELKAFLDMLNFYYRFFERILTTLELLRNCLKRDNLGCGIIPNNKRIQRKNFTTITSTQLLVHYDPANPLVISCDASPYGAATVLSHRTSNGNCRPTVFTSRTLTSAE